MQDFRPIMLGQLSQVDMLKGPSVPSEYAELEQQCFQTTGQKNYPKGLIFTPLTTFSLRIRLLEI